jgi:hypothetical protein
VWCDARADDGDGFVDIFACRCFTNADCAGVGNIAQVCYTNTFNVCGPRCELVGGDTFCQQIAPEMRCERVGPQAGECVF